MVKYLDPEYEMEAAPPQRRESRAQYLRRIREENAALPSQQALPKAREYALNLLDKQARSSAEITQKLQQRGFSTEVVEQLINRFQEVNLLADSEYAKMLVRTRFTERGLVGQALLAELVKKGIKGLEAQDALAQISADDILEKAQYLAEKKIRTVANLGRDKALKRVVSQLARKGYSSSISWNAAKCAWEKYGNDYCAESGEDFEFGSHEY